MTTFTLPENRIIKRYRAVCLSCSYRSYWYTSIQDAENKKDKHVEANPNHQVVIETEERLNRFSA